MGSYDDFHYLDIRVDEGVALVTLGDGQPGNAFSWEGHAELGRILPRLGRDDAVHSIVFTGAGDSFCVGPTAEFIRRMSADDQPFVLSVMDEVRELIHTAIECEKPVVSAINGPASGGPLTFALFSDVVIAERHVPFSDMHVTAAVAAGDGGALIWPLAMGLTRAKRYLLTGDALTAEQACECGLVTEVVEVGASRERALVYARRFAAGPPTAIRATKRALNQWLRIGLPAFELSWAGETLTASVKDARTGWDALLHGEEGLVGRDPDQEVVPSQFGERIG